MGGWFAFEQVGMSWLKHGFFALQGTTCCSNCSPGSGSALGVGCSDPYGAGLNGSQGSLGPRWQVNAHNGFFTYPPANPGWSGSTARRLEIEVVDCEPTSGSSTRYFGEGHYVTPDDAAAGNQNNNASYREMSASGSGSNWSFAYIGPTRRQLSAIRAWKVIDPTVVETEIQLPTDGFLILSNKVTDLGGGQWHYEYALYNMNANDAPASFSLAMPDGVNVTNIDFHDVSYRNGDGIGSVNRSGTDWSVTLASGKLTWSTESSLQNQNANALRWGSTYNFRFDADTPPTVGNVIMNLFVSHGQHVIPGIEQPSAPAVAGVSFCNATDGALASCPCGNAGNPDSGCDTAQATGGMLLAVDAFNPNGSGGGTGTFGCTGFSTSGSPAAVLIRSTAREPAPVPFGDGLRCIAGASLVRLSRGLAWGGAIALPTNHGAGAGTFAYQVWARNLPAGFCTPSAFNLSNGIELVWSDRTVASCGGRFPWGERPPLP
jgi:hypothetical protein